MAARRDDNRIELLDADNYSEYVLRDHREVIAVLNGLVQQRCIVAAHPDGKRDFVLTSLLGVDAASPGRLIFDAANSEDNNHKLLAAETVTFSALLDKIKVQFTAGPLETAVHDGHEALAAPPPERLLRLQRREYFRLVTPVSHSVICRITVPTSDGLKTFDARVVDISGGGIGVLVPPRGMALTTDLEFDDCSLVLPEFGSIEARLKIRSIFKVTNRNGMTMTRAGCEFIDLPRGAENTIQRYILKMERERNARARRL